MCRSIRTLRPPYVDDVSDDDMRAAALQYVRKISGMRSPARVNTIAFEEAVEAVTAATRHLLEQVEVKPRARAAEPM